RGRKPSSSKGLRELIVVHRIEMAAGRSLPQEKMLSNECVKCIVQRNARVDDLNMLDMNKSMTLYQCDIDVHHPHLFFCDVPFPFEGVPP
ncbi:1422_t:CDS:2, partial [Paraglomus occultum]